MESTGRPAIEVKVEVGPVDLDTIIGEKPGRYLGDGDYESGGDLTLADAVVEAVASKLVTSETRNGTIRERVARIRDEEIRAQVLPIVQAAITEGIQKTNSYGEPVGTPTTLRELIVKEVHDYIGKRASSDYRNATTVIQKWLQEEIGKALQAELAAALADEKAKVVAAVRAKGAELIAEAVKQGIGGAR